jgi:beta-phosphoglucomutase-like phosphatase (HAD superfamily)
VSASHGKRFRGRHLPSAERVALLRSVIARSAELARAGRSPVVVFDLDGTLLDNRPRVAAIFRDLGHAWSERHPAIAGRLAETRPDDIVYGVDENLSAFGIEEPALRSEAASFWHARFFSDAYLGHDVALAGAVGFVRGCHEAGALVVYLTGRDLGNMALGTFASLRDLGFPIGVVGAELVTKPDFATPDGVFKRAVAPSLGRLGVVVAVFDNEPDNCHALLDAHDGAVAVLVDTLTAPNPPEPLAAVRVIDSFEHEDPVGRP